MGNLKDRYCVVGIGETAYSRNSGKTTRAMGVEALHAAILDAGLSPQEVDGLLSFQRNDAAESPAIAQDLGMRPDFYLDCSGGGSTPEALVGIAIGAIEAGLCNTIAIFRTFNGASERRAGGSGGTTIRTISGPDLEISPYGWRSPAQQFQFSFTRHMYEYGTTNQQLAHVKAAQSMAASNNPRAYLKNRVSVQDVLESRWVLKPACHLLDCCLETDSSTCLIVTSAERARQLRKRPAYIMGVCARVTKPFPDMHYQADPITNSPGPYASRLLYGQAGVRAEDIQVTGAYDAFTFTPVFLLEDFGFCRKGEGGEYVSSGAIALGGSRPNNTSGGQLCEGYSHGMSMIIENVRQLRGQADDYCPNWEDSIHTYDYSEAGCRQVKDVELTMSMGWGGLYSTSALILRR